MGEIGLLPKAVERWADFCGKRIKAEAIYE